MATQYLILNTHHAILNISKVTMHALSRTIVRNSALGLVAQIAIKVLSFSFSVLVIRRLGEASFGQYAAALAFVGVFAIVSDLGLSPYMVREVARLRDLPDSRERINAMFANVMVLRLALSVVAIALVVTTVALIGQPLRMIVAVALASLSLTLYGVQGTSEAVLAGFERLDLTAGAKVLLQIVFMSAGTIALVLRGGYYGLIAANLLGVTLMAWACWRGARRVGVRWSRIQWRLWPVLLRASVPFGIIGFTLGLSYKFDTILLSQFRGDRETGYYNAAYSLVFATAMLSNVINTALYPSLSRQASNNASALGAVYGRALRYLLLASLPVAVGGSLLAHQAIPFLFGESYAPAIDALRIIIWTVPLMFASEFLGYVVLIRGAERDAARAVLISTGLNITCNLALVPLYGLYGAAIMTVLTEAVLVGQYVWRLWPVLKHFPWNTVLIRPLVAAVLMGGLVLALEPYLPFVALVAIGAGAYALLLLALGVVGGDEVRFVRSLRAATEASQ